MASQDSSSTSLFDRAGSRGEATYDQLPEPSQLYPFQKHAYNVARRLHFRPNTAIYLAGLISTAQAQNSSVVACTTEADTYVGNSQARFSIASWMRRGICIRHHNVDARCYESLLEVLRNLNELRTAEYNGSASVLALLPTIGALLGAPTTEIWRLLTIVPFGGMLAMTLSFGGAILPTNVEEYEPTVNQEVEAASSFSLLKPRDIWRESSASTKNRTDRLLKQIQRRLYQEGSVNVVKSDVWFGLLGMVLLWVGAQAAIIIIEQGAVLPWWCVSRWWMHMWYFMVTATAIAENWVQLPFSHQTKLFLSDVPYDITVNGGEDITEKLEGPSTAATETISSDESVGSAIGLALKQLPTIQAGMVQVMGSLEHTSPRNSILIMVSVIDDRGKKRMKSFWRLLSKSTTIAVFVLGTALFASAQLVALPMAVMALTLLLAAAVFGRAIASYITLAVDRSKPMIHVMVNSLSEANQIIAKIMLIHRNKDLSLPINTRAVQVEVDGHIFVDCRRIAKRSPLHVGILGIMAEPFDVATLVRRQRKYENYNQEGSSQQTREASQGSLPV